MTGPLPPDCISVSPPSEQEYEWKQGAADTQLGHTCEAGQPVSVMLPRVERRELALQSTRSSHGTGCLTGSRQQAEEANFRGTGCCCAAALLPLQVQSACPYTAVTAILSHAVTISVHGRCRHLESWGPVQLSLQWPS
ncbi:unnamed protein product [Rangifer tarandus platyrhynchus]|uniref:Uncharacterized protein n=1 Tax=Rangifer tarandus platyrhynchus TaxID=3082113 RepID=A0AC60A990_RANTA